MLHRVQANGDFRNGFSDGSAGQEAARNVPIPSHTMWAGPHDCRSVAYSPVLVSHNSVQQQSTISPNVVQNQPMKSGQAADDCAPLVRRETDKE
jgi:hypothetical protein